MIILRKAKLEDFETFKILYEDKNGLYNFLYYNTKLPISENTNSLEIELSNESLCNFYTNYSIERFKNDLSKNFWYIIEDSSKIIGNICLSYYGYGNYKITEWGMFTQNNEQKIAVLNCLKELKMPRLRRICISTIENDVAKLLLSNGFYSSVPGFFKFEI